MAQGISQEDSFAPDNNLGFFGKDKARLLVFGLFFLGLFIISIGAGLFFFKTSNSEDIEIISSEEPGKLESQVVVHIDGAVVKPGVYSLPADSRVNDLVSFAGGLTSDADRSKINLAAKLADGQKLYIAKAGESVSAVGTVAGTTSGPININSATQIELESLSGIGPVTANKIVASRPYSDSSELLTRKVVGKSVYEKIKDLITVY